MLKLNKIFNYKKVVYNNVSIKIKQARVQTKLIAIYVLPRKIFQFGEVFYD